jgi:hypothetical protein
MKNNNTNTYLRLVSLVLILFIYSKSTIAQSTNTVTWFKAFNTQILYNDPNKDPETNDNTDIPIQINFHDARSSVDEKVDTYGEIYIYSKINGRIDILKPFPIYKDLNANTWAVFTGVDDNNKLCKIKIEFFDPSHYWYAALFLCYDDYTLAFNLTKTTK